MSDTPSTSQFSSMNGFLNVLSKRTDIALALGVVCILVMLILPMPKWLLDISLALSITFAVLVLMTSLFIAKPLEFSAFPTILLISTLLRLSLNMASTRLILANGHTGPAAAGKVIEAFGDFVTGGNFVIGIIIFAILTLVNFVVITKGSGRIAEVSARFTLDAMPGKQMAIDADLSAGLINETEAKDRRKELEEESTFFGSMDGAAKFVRGDAIAGLIITFVNAIGGIIIGIAQNGLTLSQAAHSYTLLTIGDGLVSQIPALIISTASGILVSKAGVVGSADKAMIRQLTHFPSALGLCSVLMTAMSILPGMPMIPFLLLGGITGYSAYYLYEKDKKIKLKEAIGEDKTQKEKPKEQPISESLNIDLIKVELGYGLLELVSKGEGPKLTDQIRSLRHQIAREIGFIMPSVRIQDNLQLDASEYLVRIKEIEATRSIIRTNMLLAMNPSGEGVELPGEATIEPTFGLPAKWITEALKDEANFKGYTVVEPQTVITTHLTEIIKTYMPELLSYAETQKLLDELGDEHKKLIDDVIPSQLSITGLQSVLKNLLSERISIRDLPGILEGISEATHHTKNIQSITEHVRSKLSRQISNSYQTQEGIIPLITLSGEWEHAFNEALIGDGEDKQLTMPPSKLQEFIQILKDKFDAHQLTNTSPVLLVSPTIRPYIRSIIERIRPATPVMSQNEIYPKVKIKTVDQI